MKVQKKSKVRKIYKAKAVNAEPNSIPVKKVEIINDDENFEIDEITPVEQVIDFHTSALEKGDIANVEIPEREEKPKTKWGKYEKRYKVKWESDPNLKGWMLPHPGDAGKVSCRYCHCILRAHKTDLYKHCGTRKHNRNACNFSSEEKEEERKVITISKSSSKPKIITKKFRGPEGSIVIVKSEQPLFNQEEERENSRFIIDYGDNAHIETTIQSESPRNEPDQEIREIATRIGGFLADDLETLLRSQRNILKICKSAGDFACNDGKIRKMAKICVAYLSQKYLVESVLENNRPSNHFVTKEQKELSTKFKNIEEKLERTVAEMKTLMSFDSGSESLNFSSIDLGDLLGTTSNQN